jgi:hypothetical protein
LRPSAKQKKLELALQNRLEALAKLGKKDELQVALAKAQIWHALDTEQAKLAPSIGTQTRTKREIRDWKLGKSVDWKGEVANYGPKIDPDLAIKLVRHRFLLSRRYSEERAVEASARVTENDLNAIEYGALEIVTGRRGVTRSAPDLRANRLAKAVLADWFPSEPPFRLIPPKDAPSLTIEKIVHSVVPFLDELAGQPIRGGRPDKDDCPASMDPPGLGALVALARMAHPNASFEHVSDMIRSFRGLGLTVVGVDL